MDYIKDENVKIWSFLGSLPHNFIEMIEFINPTSIDEAIRMDTHCYEQGKGKSKGQLAWKGNPKGKFKQKRSRFMPPFKNKPRKF